MITLGQIATRLAHEGLLRGCFPSEAAVRDLAVRELASDSRAVDEGTLFCAVRGTTHDGHRFLAHAAAAGAVAATVERLEPQLALPQLEVADGRLGTAYAAAEFFGDPWEELSLLGVTGTNGKTSTVAILRHLLTGRRRAASLGTLGAIGRDGAPLPGSEGLTTPGAIELTRLLRILHIEGSEAVAMEVSSHALDQARVAALRFDLVVFTNLSRDHLDYHRTLDEYRSAKLRLLELLRPGGVAVVNADDPAWSDLVPAPARLVRFGMQARAEVWAEEVREGPRGTAWRLCTARESAEVRLPLYGAFNVANALAAAAALWSLGWGVEEIAARLTTVPQVPGRLERILTPEGLPTLVIDYAHTPDALARSLAALRPLTRGRLIVVFGAGGDRDRGKRPQMGRVAAQGADLTIVTSDNPRTENPAAIADDIERGMGDAPRLRVLDRREAIRVALREAGAEELILLAGKGHETYQIWGTEPIPFDERVVVREILLEMGVVL